MTGTLDDLRLAIVDVEGNGHQPPEIVEIAVVHMNGLEIAEPVAWLVKPERPINPIVTRKVHGIRNSDVADSPSFDQIASQLLATLAGRIPVAHNARVEYDVLGRHLPDWKPTIMLDTLRLAKAVWPGEASYGLDPLLTRAGVNLDAFSGSRHRASFDALATAHLLADLARSVDGSDDLYALAALPGMAPVLPDQEGLW